MILQRLFSAVLFYPTYWMNLYFCYVTKSRNWWDRVDDHMIVGALPHVGDVENIAAEGVTGVVNTCEEYGGPVQQYQQRNIEQFRMPTIDFTHPKIEDVREAVAFIDQHAEKGGTVYVHCKAGRARSATVAICWLIKNRNLSPDAAQEHLLKCRHQINPRLTQRPVVQQFAEEILGKTD